ncbi:hypothetical protein [Streptomyces hydrogenans]
MRHRTTALHRLVVAGTATVALTLGVGVPAATARAADAPSEATATARGHLPGFGAEPLAKRSRRCPGTTRERWSGWTGRVAGLCGPAPPVR